MGLATSRDIGVDLLRILAAFMVVGIHTIPSYSGSGELSDNINMWLQALVRPGLPVFFIISGAYLLTSNIKSISKWYISRFSSILIPFFTYAYIHFVFTMNISMFDMVTVRAFLTALITSKTSISVHFWFVYVLVGLYLLTPATNAIMNGMSAEGAKRAFNVILFTHGISSNPQLFQHITHTPNIYITPVVNIWMLYFICGGLLFKCKELFSFKKSAVMVLLGFLMTTLLTWSTQNKYDFSFQQYDVNVTMLIYTSGLFLLFSKNSSLFNKIGRKKIACISFISKKTYGIYLIHILVLGEMVRYMPEINMGINNHNANILFAIICFGMSLLMASFIDIPLEYLIKKVRMFGTNQDETQPSPHTDSYTQVAP